MAAATSGDPDPKRDFVFYLGMAALFSHELDAMPNHEWRGMPILRSLSDDTAMTIFVAGHVPLFALLIALVASKRARVRTLSRRVIAGFLPVHALLHFVSSTRPGYEFGSTLSNVLIFGAGILGALYLGLEASDRFQRAAR